MEIKKSEMFSNELKTLKEGVITAIKLRINLFFKNSGDDVVKEICFAEIETINGNPIFRESDEDFSTSCIDSIRLGVNEELIFTYSSELQDLKIGRKDDLFIDNVIDILTVLEELE